MRYSYASNDLCPSVTNIDLWATFPGANMMQGRNTLGYLRIDYEVLLCIEQLLCPSVTNIDLWATFPGANMVQGRNTLGYLRSRTFYTPERKYAYKYTSITKCLTCSPREIKKKIFKYPLSRPTKYSELEGVDSQICRTFLWSELDILGGICPTWEYEGWYTWSVLYTETIY